MKEVQIFALLGIGVTAALTDLRFGKIPNGLIFAGLCMGLAYQLLAKGLMGLILFLGGSLLPLALLGVLFYFRMIGAGDIKLLCAVGGFMGPGDCFGCILAAVLSGGALAVALLALRRNALKRLACFWEYASDYARTGQWESYLDRTDDSGRFCFSVPVLFAILYYAGGIL